MRFTAIEWEIIDHRLGASDAIAEVLSVEYEYDFNVVDFRAMEIQEKGQKALDLNSELDRLIIEDCCDGSTFFADIDTAVARKELSHQKAAAYMRAAETLGKKLGVTVATW